MLLFGFDHLLDEANAAVGAIEVRLIVTRKWSMQHPTTVVHWRHTGHLSRGEEAWMVDAARVAEVKQAREKWLLGLPGVTGVDIAPEGDAIRVFVRNLASRPPELEGVEEVDEVPLRFVERTFDLH